MQNLLRRVLILFSFVLFTLTTFFVNGLFANVIENGVSCGSFYEQYKGNKYVDQESDMSTYRLFAGADSDEMEENDKFKYYEKRHKKKLEKAEKEGNIYIPREWPHYDGAKTSIAVLSFEDGLSKSSTAKGLLDKDSFIQIYYGFGEGLANMMVTTLYNTGRFDIKEKNIARKLFEMYTTEAAKRLLTTEGPAIFKAPKVRYYISGSITDITTETSGLGGGLRVQGVSFSSEKSFVSITLHLRIIDAATGTVVSSRRVEASIAGSSFSAGFVYKNIGLSGTKFERNPLGHAIQKLLDRCADEIIATTS